MKKQRRGLYRYKVPKATEDYQLSPGGPSSRRKSIKGLIPLKMASRCCNNLAAKTKVKTGYPVRNMVMSAGFVEIIVNILTGPKTTQTNQRMKPFITCDPMQKNQCHVSFLQESH